MINRPEIKDVPIPVATPLARRTNLDAIIAETANSPTHTTPWLIQKAPRVVGLGLVILGIATLYNFVHVHMFGGTYFRKSVGLGGGAVTTGMFLLIVGSPTDRRGNPVDGWRQAIGVTGAAGLVLGFLLELLWH